MEKGKGALAGRGLASGPLAEAGPACPRSPPSPRSRPCRVHARGRPRRAAVASRRSSAATWRACDGLDEPWSATKNARSRPPPSPLPFALAGSSSPAFSPSLRVRRAPPSPLEPELRHGRFSPAREPFFDSSLREIRPRFAVAEHASERVVTHGEPRSPSFPSPARAPPPRA